MDTDFEARLSRMQTQVASMANRIQEQGDALVIQMGKRSDLNKRFTMHQAFCRDFFMRHRDALVAAGIPFEMPDWWIWDPEEGVQNNGALADSGQPIGDWEVALRDSKRGGEIPKHNRAVDPASLREPKRPATTTPAVDSTFRD